VPRHNNLSSKVAKLNKLGRLPVKKIKSHKKEPSLKGVNYITKKKFSRFYKPFDKKIRQFFFLNPNSRPINTITVNSNTMKYPNISANFSQILTQNYDQAEINEVLVVKGNMKMKNATELVILDTNKSEFIEIAQFLLPADLFYFLFCVDFQPKTYEQLANQVPVILKELDSNKRDILIQDLIASSLKNSEFIEDFKIVLVKILDLIKTTYPKCKMGNLDYSPTMVIELIENYSKEFDKYNFKSYLTTNKFLYAGVVVPHFLIGLSFYILALRSTSFIINEQGYARGTAQIHRMASKLSLKIGKLYYLGANKIDNYFCVYTVMA